MNTNRENLYNEAKKINTFVKWIGFIYIVITILATVFGGIVNNNDVIGKISVVLNVIVSLILIIAKVGFLQVFKKAEKERRDYFIDNSFGTILADDEKRGYYGSVDIEYGVEKCLINIHESSFFSSHIASVMNKRMILRAIGMILMCSVIVIFISDSNITVLLFQIIFTLTSVFDVYGLVTLNHQAKLVCDRCKDIWSDYKKADRKGNLFYGRAIREIIRYETALAYSKIMLDEKLHNNKKNDIDEKWKIIKAKYDI